MDIAIKALQLILSLSILVITHEAGHFFFAKLFKTRVEKFYLFFDPWFSLFKFKKGETEYGIGWLPLGGYVKISGMIDESMDKEQLAQEPQPWEFRSKPAWQRLLIMLGGVLVNAITAPIIFWFILFTWGETYIPINESKLAFHPVMHEAGFVDGDRIVGVNGKAVDTYKDVANTIILENECTINIIRDNNEMSIQMPNEFFRKILDQDVQQLFQITIPVVVDSAIAGHGAALAGFQRGDSIIAVNGRKADTFDTFTAILSEYKDSIVDVAYVRQGVTDTAKVKLNSEGKMGFYGYSAQRWITPKHKEFGFFEALPAGINKGTEILVNYVKQLPLIFTREGATKIGGFGTIGNMFPETWDWQSFWFNTAFLAVILAFMNILPIPALDGGHVLFLLVEIITRRKPSDKFLEYAQMTGMALLFALLIWANFNDIIRAFFN